MRITLLTATAAVLLLFTMGCCGTGGPSPRSVFTCTPCAPGVTATAGMGFMPALPRPQSPECPPARIPESRPMAATHRLGGGMVANSSAVRVTRVPANTFVTRVCLPSRSAAPTVSTTPAAGTPVRADIATPAPVRVDNLGLCTPGDNLSECYTLPEGESAAADMELYVPAVADAEPDKYDDDAAETATADAPAETDDGVTTAETPEAADAPAFAESAEPAAPERIADDEVASRIALPDEVDATVTLVAPETEAVTEHAPAAVTAPEEALAENTESATLISEAVSAPAESAVEEMDDRAYLAMPKLPSEMTRDRAIIEDRLTSLPAMADLDGIGGRDDGGVPMVELPPKLD